MEHIMGSSADPPKGWVPRLRLQPHRQHQRRMPRVRDGGGGEGGYSMRRKAFGFVSALSLLLCVATMVLWVRSYNKFDDLDRFTTSLTPTDFTQDCIRLGS